MLRKLAAILVMILSALGFIFCLAVLVGAWLVNEPATAAITESLDTADTYLNKAGETAAQVNVRLGDVQSKVDSLAANSPELAAQMRETLELKVGPVITRAEATIAGLQNGIAVANQILVQLDRLPVIEVPSGDELQDLDQRIIEVSAKVDDLTSALAAQDFDGARVAAAASAISDDLATIQSTLALWSTRIDTVQAAIASARAAIPELLDRTSLVVSLLAFLLGAGQITLFMQSLNWFRLGASFRAL